jgi:hypothetical protein
LLLTVGLKCARLFDAKVRNVRPRYVQADEAWTFVQKKQKRRRFTRLTNGFSKKLENLKAAVSLFMAWYNFCRVHQTLRVTPAIEEKLTDHIWTIRELLTAA